MGNRTVPYFSAGRREHVSQALWRTLVLGCGGGGGAVDLSSSLLGRSESFQSAS